MKKWIEIIPREKSDAKKLDCFFRYDFKQLISIVNITKGFEYREKIVYF